MGAFQCRTKAGQPGLGKEAQARHCLVLLHEVPLEGQAA